MKILRWSFFIGMISIAVCAQKESNINAPKLTFLWETKAMLNDLESVIYNEKEKMLYVTNINGHWLKPNGKGFISKVNLNGEIAKHKWIDNIDGPTGTAIYKDRLFVADFDTVLEIDLHTERIVKKHKIDETERINDLCVTSEGTVFGSGTKSGMLFAIHDGKISIVQKDLEWPNGVLCKEDGVLIGLGDATIRSYNFKTKNIEILTKGISNPDGIVAVGNGDYLVSSWEGMIHYVTKNGDKTLLLDTRKEKVNAADITYIPSLQMVLVPAMLQHKLMAYKLVL